MIAIYEDINFNIEDEINAWKSNFKTQLSFGPPLRNSQSLSGFPLQVDHYLNLDFSSRNQQFSKLSEPKK